MNILKWRAQSTLLFMHILKENSLIVTFSKIWTHNVVSFSSDKRNYTHIHTCVLVGDKFTIYVEIESQGDG